jgi:RNA polymerase sigma-70 factor (ECF subfamily)
MANPLETTAVLLSRAQAGDHDALNQLLARYLPRLNRWAHGRLPNTSRDLADTHDLVQETLINALKRLASFELTHGAGFQAYLRQSILNRIRNEIRRTHGQPPRTPLDEHHPDDAQSPLDVVIGRQSVERYEAALARLRPEEQDAIVVRLELGCSYEEVAAALNKPSVDAARMTVRRAIARLVAEMGRDGA